MKIALFAVALGLLISTNAHAQAVKGYASLPKDSLTHKVSYSGVVQVPKSSQQELLSRGVEWMARQKEVVAVPGQVGDPASGPIVRQFAWKQDPLSFTDTHANLYTFTVAVYAKDGRYRYLVNDISYQNINPALVTKDAQQAVPMESYAAVKPNKRNTATLADFDKHLRGLVASLTQAMNAKSF
jgi:hypothetical protein